MLEIMRDLIGTQGLAVMLIAIFAWVAIVLIFKLFDWAFSQKDGDARGMLTKLIDRRIKTEEANAEFMNRTSQFMERTKENDEQFTEILRQQVANCLSHEQNIVSLNDHFAEQTVTGKQMLERLNEVAVNTGSDGAGFTVLNKHTLDGMEALEILLESARDNGISINHEGLDKAIQRIKTRAARHSRDKE